MKRTLVCGVIASTVALLWAGPRLLSGGEERAGSAQPSAEEMQEMMKNWMAVASPGPHHRKLQPFVGSWKLTMKSWWGGPGGEPVVTQGTSTTRWVLESRFLMDEVKSEVAMPGPDGAMKKMPFEGIGLSGYDNYRKQYVGMWADSMGTHMLTYTGTASPDGKVFTYYGQMDEPMLGVTGRMVRYVTRVISDDKHVFEMYDLHAGENHKAMEIVYERTGK